MMIVVLVATGQLKDGRRLAALFVMMVTILVVAGDDDRRRHGPSGTGGAIPTTTTTTGAVAVIGITIIHVLLRVLAPRASTPANSSIIMVCQQSATAGHRLRKRDKCSHRDDSGSAHAAV